MKGRVGMGNGRNGKWETGNGGVRREKKRGKQRERAAIRNEWIGRRDQYRLI